MSNYTRCYLISIVCIFMVLFPMLFFADSGYTSGMPLFFLFAVMFTAFMLRGRLALIMLALDISLYAILYTVAYFFPELHRPYADDGGSFLAMLSSFLLISAILGLVMHIHFAAYERQQKELEQAREQALQLSEIKTAFLANMSHEIRTPINVILGMNEMILRE